VLVVKTGAGVALNDVAVDGHDVFIATSSANVGVDPNWRITIVDDALANIGAPQAVLNEASSFPSSGPMTLAFDDGHRAAMAWDSVDLCRFMQLDAEGAPSGERNIGKGTCDWLTPRAGGFYLIRSHHNAIDEPRTLVLLDQSGSVVGKSKHIAAKQFHDDTVTARARLTNGNLAVAWQGGAGDVVTGQAFDVNGAAVGAPTMLPANGEALGEAIFAMAPTDGGVLTVYTTFFEAPPQRVVATAWDGTTNGVGQQHSVFSGSEMTGTALAVTAAGGSVLVAYSLLMDSKWFVQPVTASGEPIGARIEANTPTPPGFARMVATPRGAMLVFDAGAGEVYALNLVCSNCTRLRRRGRFVGPDASSRLLRLGRLLGGRGGRPRVKEARAPRQTRARA
jgi:hypothetical protein